MRDGKFWLPLIGLFAGLRLEEACQLAVADFRKTGGLWVMDVTGDEDGRVKKRSSNRTVPVHPELIRLGLVEHVDAVRKAGGGRLFPELKAGGPGGTLLHEFSKWFGRYVEAIGLKAPGLTLHSFRKNVASALQGAGVPERVAADILGHEHKSLSYRLYSEGAAASA